MQDSITEAEVRLLMDRPGFRPRIGIFLTAPEDVASFLEFREKILTYSSAQSQPPRQNRYAALFGKEQLYYSDQAENTIWPGRTPFVVLPATLMANSDYQPLSEYYDVFYTRLKDNQDPWSLCALSKYAIALGKHNEAAKFKNMLKEQSQDMDISNPAKYFFFSIEAHST